MFMRKLCPHLNHLYKNNVALFRGFDTIKLPVIHFYSDNHNLVQSPISDFLSQPGETPKKKKKTEFIPRITLLNGDEITVSTLEEAQKLAKRRDLKLVKILDLDTKTDRPVYKLMTGAEYYKEDLKQREKKKTDKQKENLKGEKVMFISQNISEHDLQTNANKVLKWLLKKYEVRVVINGTSDNISKAENVYSLLEKIVISQGRIVQKRQKGSDIKFQILPPKEVKQGNEGSSPGSNNTDPPK